MNKELYILLTPRPVRAYRVGMDTLEAKIRAQICVRLIRTLGLGEEQAFALVGLGGAVVGKRAYNKKTPAKGKPGPKPGKRRGKPGPKPKLA
jgi:hypothetical protein